jgi:predicted transcriptional regulator
MFVRDWMSTPPITIAPTTTLADALDLLEKRRIRRTPVVDDRGLVGIATKSDLQAALSRPDTDALPVSKIMTKKPSTVAPDETIEGAAQLMLHKKISGLPVVEDGRVVGIITESDLFRALCGVLGVGEKGARITFTLKEDDDLLATIAKRTAGMAVRSLVTVHDAKRGAWHVTIRVRGRVPAKV